MGGSAGEAAAGDPELPAGLEMSDLLKLSFYGFFFAMVAFMMWTGLGYTWEDRIFPTLVGVPTLALILAQIVFVVRPDVKERFVPSGGEAKSLQEKFSESIEGVSGEGRPTAERRKWEIALVAWITLLPVVMYVFGMVLTLPVYVFAFVYFFKKNLREAAITTVIFSGLTYLVFVAFLQFRPFPGILFG